MASYYQSSSSFRRHRTREDVDPMSSMGNIGDIMLVFACGLMVALVVAWNVDLAQFQQVDMDQELNQDEVTEMTEELYGEGDSFVEMGKVYQDPSTGKYYLVEDNASSSRGSASEDGASSSRSSAGTDDASSARSSAGEDGTWSSSDSASEESALPSRGSASTGNDQSKVVRQGSESGFSSRGA